MIAIVHLDLYKFLNRLTAYRAFIGLKSMSICTLTAHTLEKYNRCNMRIIKLENENRVNFDKFLNKYPWKKKIK